MNSNYVRVIPRDLFNEAKLLKCIGLLCLKIHDRLCPDGLDFCCKRDGDPFKIALLDEGALCVTNITFQIHDTIVTFQTTYNSKEPYPLVAYHDYCEYQVFDEDGTFSDDFIDFCQTIKK